MGHAPVDRDAEVRHLAEDVRVVRLGVDRLGEVLADLVRVDVERGHELDVAHVVAAELDVHEPGDGLGGIGVGVEGAALDEAARAVADADDRDADRPSRAWHRAVAVAAVRRRAVGRCAVGGGRVAHDGRSPPCEMGLRDDEADALDDGERGEDRDEREAAREEEATLRRRGSG